MDQVGPLRSTRVREAKLVGVKANDWPTATHTDELRQSTPFRLPGHGSWFGLGTIAHAPLARLSTTVRWFPLPTAMQCVASTHETSLSSFSAAPRFGLGTDDHTPPDQVWIRVRWMSARLT